MAVPEFDAAGSLPPGTHQATWDEVVSRFGCRITDPDGGKQRQALLLGLRRALEQLSAVGCRRVWLGGSFVTDKEGATGVSPGHVDVCWDATAVSFSRLLTTAPALHPLHGDRQACQRRYGGDYFAVTEPLAIGMLADFRSTRDGRYVGIVELVLRLVEVEG